MAVIDDGPGFDPATALGPVDGHIGLALLADAAEGVGGRLDLRSRPGRGTTVKATIPLPELPEHCTQERPERLARGGSPALDCMQSEGWGGAVTAAADRAYGALRDGILDGRYGFGDKLGEIEIAEELGLSRTPVREALRRLGSEGLIEVLPNRGARVRTWTAQDLEETYELRAVLEGLAARRAATRIDPAALDEMDRLAATMIDRRPEPRPPPGRRLRRAGRAQRPLPRADRHRRRQRAAGQHAAGARPAPARHAHLPALHARPRWPAATPTTGRSSTPCAPGTAGGPRASCARTSSPPGPSCWTATARTPRRWRRSHDPRRVGAVPCGARPRARWPGSA